MNTRCKFRCSGVLETEGDTGFNYDFVPVYSDDPESENKKFWEFTPSGKLEIGCVSKKDFQVGKEYYIDIISAD